MAIATSINNVLTKLILVNLVCLMNRELGDIHLIEQVIPKPFISLYFPLLLFLSDNLTLRNLSVLPYIRMILHVRIDNEGCKSIILLFIDFILDD